MARIRDSKPKDVTGGYIRLFNDPVLGALMSKIQSAVIRSGNELEGIIRDKTRAVDDLDRFLKLGDMEEGVFVAHKKKVKKSEILNFDGAEPDFIIFKKRDNQMHCHVVELKDGHSFDTKKSEGEAQSMRKFINENSRHMPCTVSGHFCSFNKEDRKDIVQGFKGKIKESEAMTGREFCELLELDYDSIVVSRKGDAEDNLNYLLSELTKIPKVEAWLKKHFV